MKVILDFNNINTKEELHILLRESFKLENYHNNYDSLYDELTSRCDIIDVEIVNIEYAKKMIGQYVDILENVLMDVKQENNTLTISYKKN